MEIDKDGQGIPTFLDLGERSFEEYCIRLSGIKPTFYWAVAWFRQED